MNATEGADRFQRNKFASCPFGTPPLPNLPPRDPLSAPPGQVLALRNQTLMDGAGQKDDEIMTNPMENIAKALMVLHVRIQGTKLIQDAPLGIATLALNH